jgi:hypothetical protein
MFLAYQAHNIIRLMTTIFFIDFLNELGLFIEEKPIYTIKKISATLPSAVISWLSK